MNVFEILTKMDNCCPLKCHCRIEPKDSVSITLDWSYYIKTKCGTKHYIHRETVLLKEYAIRGDQAFSFAIVRAKKKMEIQIAEIKNV